jgi:hypothetical protein
MSEPPIIKAHNLYKTYRAGDIDVHALQGANLEVSRAEFVAWSVLLDPGNRRCLTSWPR